MVKENERPPIHTGFHGIAVIGGEIVGLSTAPALKSRFPQFSLAVLEKESESPAIRPSITAG